MIGSRKEDRGKTTKESNLSEDKDGDEANDIKKTIYADAVKRTKSSLLGKEIDNVWNKARTEVKT